MEAAGGKERGSWEESAEWGGCLLVLPSTPMCTVTPKLWSAAVSMEYVKSDVAWLESNVMVDGLRCRCLMLLFPLLIGSPPICIFYKGLRRLRRARGTLLFVLFGMPLACIMPTLINQDAE